MAGFLELAWWRLFFKRAEHSPLCDSGMRGFVVTFSVRGAAVWMRIDGESRRLQPRGLRSLRRACGALRAPQARVFFFSEEEVEAEEEEEEGTVSGKNFALAAGDLPKMAVWCFVFHFRLRTPSRLLIVLYWSRG